MAAAAQDAPTPRDPRMPATIPAGVPLRVVLERRTPIRRVGEPIRGRLLDSLYVYDRMALPAGSLVEGYVAEIGGIPARKRITGILSGNFTPPRQAAVQFNILVLSDGSRLPLQTALSGGTAHCVAVAKRGSQPPGRDRRQSALQAPGTMARLKDALLERFPYHRQAWRAGTLFSGVLQKPLRVPAPTAPLTGPAAAESGPMGVSARLLTPLSSASARRGTPVEAVVTRPQFSADHHLLIPEGSRLHGEVVEARPARRLHRSGKLLFVFRRIDPPGDAARNVQGYLEGAQADFSAHLAIDSEGAVRAKSPNSRFIFPAIAVAAAGLSLHQDYNSAGVPDQDLGGRAESGAVGLGLIGALLAQASHSLASSMAFAGAGFSIYTNFLTRGEDVVLPANTPVEISLKPAREAAAGRR